MFSAVDLKARIRQTQDFLIGLGDQQQAYLHVQVSIMAGRSEEVRRQLAATLVEALQPCDYLIEGRWSDAAIGSGAT